MSQSRDDQKKQASLEQKVPVQAMTRLKPLSLRERRVDDGQNVRPLSNEWVLFSTGSKSELQNLKNKKRILLHSQRNIKFYPLAADRIFAIEGNQARQWLDQSSNQSKASPSNQPLDLFTINPSFTPTVEISYYHEFALITGRTQHGNTFDTYLVQFLPDGLRLVSMFRDTTCAAFIGKSQSIAIAFRKDGTIRYWEIVDGEINEKGILHQNCYLIDKLKVSPDANYFYIVLSDSKVAQYDQKKCDSIPQKKFFLYSSESGKPLPLPDKKDVPDVASAIVGWCFNHILVMQNSKDGILLYNPEDKQAEFQRFSYGDTDDCLKIDRDFLISETGQIAYTTLHRRIFKLVTTELELVSPVLSDKAKNEISPVLLNVLNNIADLRGIALDYLANEIFASLLPLQQLFSQHLITYNAYLIGEIRTLLEKYNKKFADSFQHESKTPVTADQEILIKIRLFLQIFHVDIVDDIKKLSSGHAVNVLEQVGLVPRNLPNDVTDVLEQILSPIQSPLVFTSEQIIAYRKKCGDECLILFKFFDAFHAGGRYPEKQQFTLGLRSAFQGKPLGESYEDCARRILFDMPNARFQVTPDIYAARDSRIIEAIYSVDFLNQLRRLDRVAERVIPSAQARMFQQPAALIHDEKKEEKKQAVVPRGHPQSGAGCG